MKILLLHGSARKQGNTALLLNDIIQGIQQTSASWEYIHLPELDIHPCIGCGACEKQGFCVFNDDMQPLYEKIANADSIIIGSPIYFYALTAQTKAFIDRCQALWSRKYILKQQIGKNNKSSRHGYLVSVAATHGKRIFEGARLSARYAFDAMDCSYTDDFLIPGMDHVNAIKASTDTRIQAVSFGRQLIDR